MLLLTGARRPIRYSEGTAAEIRTAAAVSAGDHRHCYRGLGYKTQTADQPGQLLCHTMMVSALSYNYTHSNHYKKREKFTLFSDHTWSLLRRQAKVSFC